MKSRTVAILLAFFCGGIGIHKFYLGQAGWGILYFLFCWTFIPSIVAFFEFIGLVIMSDQAFDIQYNKGILNSSYSNPYLGSSQDKTAVLTDLKKLYDSGIITAEEYEQKRRKYLDSL
jgi:TM2 domain-containing membrane protein YozV